MSARRDAGQQALPFLRQMFPPQESDQCANVRLVCTLRSDFLPDLLDLPDIGPRLQDRQLNVSPLDEAALTRVIVEPAALTDVTFADGLPEHIASEASKGSGGLPLLEFTLTELWPQQRSRQITFDSYHSLGGVSGALNRHAECVYRALLDQQVDESRIRRTLLSMVRARNGAGDAVRVTARRTHLRQDWTVAQRMAGPEHRLVVLGTSGPDTAEIAHEALILGWQRFAGWVNADANFQKWLAMAEERAAEGDLLSAPRVSEAKGWLSERPEDIPQEVVELVADSYAALEDQRKTLVRLQESQQQAEELRMRSRDLELRQSALKHSNFLLEEKAARLRESYREIEERNSEIEVRNIEIEEAREVLQGRAEQLAVSMRYKSEFLGNYSRELRAPLNTLLIIASALADGSTPLASGQLELVQGIHDHAADLLQMVNDVVDLTNVETGKMEVSPGPVSLDAIVGHIDADYRPIAAQAGLSFFTQLAPDISVLHTDELRLLQILRCLLSNALQFTHAGAVKFTIRMAGDETPLAIREQLLEQGLLAEPEAGIVAFSVTDTGAGIAASKMRVIFEAFTQTDAGEDGKRGGIGLGLPISRQVARLLGGEIYAASELGRGSTFTLYLPAQPAYLWAPSLPVLEPPAVTGRLDNDQQERFDGDTVLLVDADVRHSFELARILEGVGLKLLYAENGTEVPKVLNEWEDVDVVLVDTHPQSKGHLVLDAIRRTPRFQNVPVIMMVADTMERAHRLSWDAGAAGYLTLPLDTKSLISILRRFLPAK